jgi:hypothetical protein
LIPTGERHGTGGEHREDAVGEWNQARGEVVVSGRILASDEGLGLAMVKKCEEERRHEVCDDG